jgi:hypothetical protein
MRKFIARVATLTGKIAEWLIPVPDRHQTSDWVRSPTAMIVNYEFKYRSRGKWFFVPNDKCERRGQRMLAYFKRRVVFPVYMYHFKEGGHARAPE